jgi:hypothetical protein
MREILGSYLFWTYKRGSIHYDIMVTLILLFIFLSPLGINYHDRPVGRDLPPSQMLVKSDGHNGLMFRIDRGSLPVQSKNNLEQELKAAIEPVSGEVKIDRFEAVMGADDKTVIAYRVWAHK